MHIKFLSRISLLLVLVSSLTFVAGGAKADNENEASKESGKLVGTDGFQPSPVVGPESNIIKLRPLVPHEAGLFEIVHSTQAGMDENLSRLVPHFSSATADFGFAFKQFQAANEVPISSIAEGHDYRRNLWFYVCEPLRKAVSAFDRGEYKEALNLIKVLRLDYHRYPIYEPYYVRALCLQRLERFDEASTQYKAVIESSQNKELKERAAVGLESCTKHEVNLPEFLLRFPSGRSVLLLPGGSDVMDSY